LSGIDNFGIFDDLADQMQSKSLSKNKLKNVK